MNDGTLRPLPPVKNKRPMRYGRSYRPKPAPRELTAAEETERRCAMCGEVCASWFDRAMHLVVGHGWRHGATLLLLATVACSSSPTGPDAEPEPDFCEVFECWPNDPHPIDDPADVDALLPDSVCVAWRFGPPGDGPSDVPRCDRWKAGT